MVPRNDASRKLLVTDTDPLAQRSRGEGLDTFRRLNSSRFVDDRLQAFPVYELSQGSFRWQKKLESSEYRLFSGLSNVFD